MPYDPYEENDEERAKNRAPSATNFTNFGRYFSGNKAAADREALKLGTAAETNARRASNSLKDTQQTFSTNVGTGSVPTNNTAPNAAMSAQQEAQMRANATGSYTGPMGLNDVAGYENTVAQSNAAQSNLNALGSTGGVQALVQQNNPEGNQGTSALSAGLIGGVGRGNFDRLRARFSPDKELKTAGEQAARTGEEAKAASKANAESWQSTADLRDKQAANQKAKDDAARASEAQARQDALTRIPISKLNDPMAGVDKNDPIAVAKAKADFEQFRLAVQKDAGDEFRTAMHAASPLTNLVGDVLGSSIVTPFEGMGNQLGAAVHQNDPAKKANGGGVYSGQHIPWQFETDWPVYRSMSSGDWAALRGMNTHAQKRWITQRRDEIYKAAAKNPEPLPRK